MNDELSAQAERFPLQGQVDEVHGLTKLLLCLALGDLVGVELQRQPVDGDDFHVVGCGVAGWASTVNIFCTFSRPAK